jgi:hypothetical protein
VEVEPCEHADRFKLARIATAQKAVIPVVRVNVPSRDNPFRADAQGTGALFGARTCSWTSNVVSVPSASRTKPAKT